MRKSLFFFSFFSFFSFFCLALSGTVYAEENAAYSVLDKPVVSAVQDNETVVEFFSFYCPSCYAFSQDYGIDKA
ncbi:thiol:disulfide interchange protein, partial [Escherichia marmotae]|nr:thiol:disulfide interchange protein [Escherichia marmotae]